MKTAAIVSLGYGALAASALTPTLSDPVVFPTSSPKGGADPSKCATHNYGSLLDAPAPTGRLEGALGAYAAQLYESCTASNMDVAACIWPYPEMCGFATAAPSLISEYTSYGSAASSWWEAHGSAIHSVAKECPHNWYDVMSYDSFEGAGVLDTPLRLAQCLEDFPITTGDHATVDPTATSGPGEAGPEKTEEAGNNGAGETGAVQMLAVAVFGLGAAIMNAL